MLMDCRISKNAKVAGCGLRFWKDGLPRRMLHARCYSKSGGDGRQDSDGDVDDFLPDFLLVHGCLVLMVGNCHPDDRREEGSRVHSRACPRRSFASFHSVRDDIRRRAFTHYAAPPYSSHEVKSSPPSSSSGSSLSLVYFTETFWKVSPLRAPTSALPGRKLMRAFLMRVSE